VFAASWRGEKNVPFTLLQIPKAVGTPTVLLSTAYSAYTQSLMADNALQIVKVHSSEPRTGADLNGLRQ
jgi:hypothetical protein